MCCVLRGCSQLIAAFFFVSSAGAQGGPPSPPGLASDSAPVTPPAEINRLLEKAGLDEIPLLAGFNLISIPKEPADTDPAAAFTSVADALGRVEAYDACDLADPWKVYDPTDPATSDLTVVDPAIGMWVKATAAAILPTAGNLAATTTLELCAGWNLIGFPTGEPRHPHSALASIAGKWRRIFGYDAFDSEDPWEVFSVDVPDWANDLRLMQPGRGYWVLATEAATLEIRNDGPPPTVAIASPADLAVVTQPTEILGTAFSDRLDNWTLTSRPISGGDAVTLATGNAPISGGTLATFDPTLLLNGLYELELTATDVQGQQVTDQIAVSVEGQMKIGHFTLSFVDLAIPVSGLDLQIIRTYDSRDKRQRDFGVGWSLDIRQGSYRNNRTPGDGWQLGQSLVACDTVQETKSHLTVVRLSDREVYRFALRLQNGAASTGGGCVADARFDYIDGPFVDATLDILGQTQVFWAAGSDHVIDVDTLETYEPRQVRLKTRGGRTFDLDLTDGVTRLEDRNGNELQITTEGLTHSNGLEIGFERDASGRIERIIDLAGASMTYTYDGVGDLVRFQDRLANVTSFGYRTDHLLESIRNSEGREILTASYDGDGRIDQQCDALVRCTELAHDLDAKIERRIGPTNLVTTFHYDDRGNVVRFVDGLDGEWTWEYNSRDRLIRQRDAMGAETVFEYDTRDNPIAKTTPHRPEEDPADFTTSYAYDNDRLKQVTRPDGTVWTLEHDTRGNLRSVKDTHGDTVHSATYDTRGDLLSEGNRFGTMRYEALDAFGQPGRAVDVLGTVTTIAYDALGSITQVEEGGIVETYEPDAFGREGRVVYSPDHQHQTQYDEYGRWTSQTGSFSGRLARRFDLAGRLEAWEAPGGAEVAFERDAAGLMTAQVDPMGRRTELRYDAAGRLDRLLSPATGETLYERDAAGRVTKVTDALGHATELLYHPSGLIERRRDALAREWSFAYGPNWSEATDPLERTTRAEASPEGELVRLVHADDAEVTIEYLDAAPTGERDVYPTAIVDEADRRRELGYNAVGQLSNATDLAQASWSYTYTGPYLTGITAPSGETVVTQTWDTHRRLMSRSYGDGGTYTFTYGPGPEPTRVTLPSLATLDRQYDVNGSLTSQVASTGETESYSYNTAGQLKSAAGGTTTTSHGYDAGGRLASVSQTDGSAVLFKRDALGRATRVTAQGPAAGTAHATSYDYDAVGNLTTIEDPAGGLTSIEYDAVNRPIHRQLPNGIVTEWTYDDRDRVATVEHRDSEGVTIASFTYTRDLTGEPIRVEREDGSAVELDYDDALRLTAERRFDSAGVLFEENGWQYDDDGHRIHQTRDATVYDLAYEPGFRLSGVTSEGITVESYGWDTTGRVASIDRPQGTWALAYDSEDQLTRASGDEVAVTYGYDAEGRRISASDGSQTRRFIVAPALGGGLESTHLIHEQGQTSAYVWAGQQPLARVIEGGPAFYYLTDGLGSVVALTDAAGDVEGTVTYDPFGEVREDTVPAASPAAGHGGDFRFHGAWLEAATGLYHLRARDYDPVTGRFLTRDPAPPDLRQPETIHPYAFAFSNPQLFSDPTGLFTLAEVNITFSAQNTMEGLKAQAVREARQEVFDYLSEGLTEYMLQFLEIHMGMELSSWAIPAGLEFPQAGWKIGEIWENAVTDTLCTILGPAGQYLYFQPRIVQDTGEARDNGFSCEERAQGGRKGKGVKGQREPDFLLRMSPPTAKGDTLITGEIKYSIHGFYKSYYSPGSRVGQWRAIHNHARYFGKPVKLTFLFAFSGSRKYQFKRMKQLVREARVAGVIVAIIDPKR